jgi:chorismate synthase
VARLRHLTAGECHGPAPVATLEGFPVSVSKAKLPAKFARHRLGFDRRPRMRCEVGELEILGGVSHVRTLGSPVMVVIRNTEWQTWRDAIPPDSRDDLDSGRSTGRSQRLTPPWLGHADLVTTLKGGHDDGREALERASAPQSRVVFDALAKRLLDEVSVNVDTNAHEPRRRSPNGPAPASYIKPELCLDTLWPSGWRRRRSRRASVRPGTRASRTSWGTSRPSQAGDQARRRYSASRK